MTLHTAESRPEGTIVVAIIILLAAVLGMVAFFGLRAIIRAQRNKARTFSQRNTLEWVTDVENATTDEQIAGRLDLDDYQRENYLPADGWESLDDRNRESAAKRKFREAKLRHDARKISKDLGVDPKPYDVAKACLQVHQQGLSPELALDIRERELGALFVSSMERTLAMVRQGDLLAMSEYVNVLNQSHATTNLCSKHDVTQPAYPADWDDMVIEFMENPSVSDFRNTPRLHAAQVQSLAASALAHENVGAAKLVLAYCQEERVEVGQKSYHGRYGYSGGSRQVIWPFRDAIGDVLLAELLKMIERLTGSEPHVTARSQTLR